MFAVYINIGVKTTQDEKLIYCKYAIPILEKEIDEYKQQLQIQEQKEREKKEELEIKMRLEGMEPDF